MPKTQDNEYRPDPARASTTEGLPIAPDLEPTLEANRVPQEPSLVDRRVVLISALSMLVAVGAALVAKALVALIGFVTNLAFFGQLSSQFVSPADNKIGLWVLLVPTVGGLLVGLMARYGSQAIRGHGIPEAMEQILTNQSRIPPRITFLKPISSAIAIGTGGPFGAEGPIIATGGALGSLVGQLLRTTASERKALLAAGAAAGMTAIFGSPVSAVILAVELLLFELRPRTIIPVALACAVADAVRHVIISSGPVFPMPHAVPPGLGALACYVVIGALIGIVAVVVTKLVYLVEDGFEKLPVHWMWWPAIGGLFVGIVGYFAPRTLGVGYDNIDSFLTGKLLGVGLLWLALAKLASWSLSLGSGTSGGTLAPLFTIGGGLGGVLGGVAAAMLPSLGIDPRIAGLVGMAAIFAGASRALLASVVFAFETTLQPLGLLPLLGGCTAAFLVSCLLMRNTIMTEKIVRRGIRVPSEYQADYLAQIEVGAVALKPVVCLLASDTLEHVLAWLAERSSESHHQGYPVIDDRDRLIGVLTRRDLFDPDLPPSATVRSIIHRPPAVVFTHQSLRDAADHMVHESVGRLPVVSRDEPSKVLGIITRSDLLVAHKPRLRDSQEALRNIRIRRLPTRHSG